MLFDALLQVAGDAMRDEEERKGSDMHYSSPIAKKRRTPTRGKRATSPPPPPATTSRRCRRPPVAARERYARTYEALRAQMSACATVPPSDVQAYSSLSASLSFMHDLLLSTRNEEQVGRVAVVMEGMLRTEVHPGVKVLKKYFSSLAWHFGRACGETRKGGEEEEETFLRRMREEAEKHAS